MLNPTTSVDDGGSDGEYGSDFDEDFEEQIASDIEESNSFINALRWIFEEVSKAQTSSFNSPHS